ncbi:MAG: hypothetical protein ACHP65_06350 [Legionellales bacterium]
MSLSRWFKHQNKQRARLVTLEQTLLDGRYKAYGFFRLKFFNVQLLINFMAHLLLMTLFFHHFTLLHASHLILMVALSFTLNCAWWGGLEVMREQVRASFMKGPKHAVGAIIGQWLLVSIIGALVFSLIALLALIHYNVSIQAVNAKYNLSLVSLVISLAIQLPVRVYHSGIYAINRVARSTFSMFIADLVFIAALLISAPFLGVYNIPLAILLRNMSGQWMIVHYVKRAYLARNIQLQWPSFSRMRSFVALFPAGNFIKASLSMTSMTLEHLIIALWFLWTEKRLDQQDNITLLVFILPLLYASVDWARLFYFDYKKTIHADFSQFYSKFERHVTKIATISGFFYWALACLTNILLMPVHSLTLCLWLLPLFILRSKIAMLQIKHFAQGHYTAVLLYNLLFISTVALIYSLPVFWMSKFMLLIMLCVLLIACLRIPLKTRIASDSALKKPLHIYAWLQSLREAVDASCIEVHVFQLQPHLKTKPRFALVNQLLLHFYNTQHELCIYNQQLLLFTNKMEVMDTETLLIISGGWVRQHRVLRLASVAMIKNQLLAQLDPPLPRPIIQEYSIEAIKATFFRYFPYGFCFGPDYQLGPSAKPLSSATLQRLLQFSKKYLADSQKQDLADYFLSVFYCAHSINIIFLIPKGAMYSIKDQGCHPLLWQKNIDFVSKMQILG